MFIYRWKLVSFYKPLPIFPKAPSPWQLLFYPRFYEFDFSSDSTYKWYHAVFVFLCLAYFT